MAYSVIEPWCSHCILGSKLGSVWKCLDGLAGKGARIRIRYMEATQHHTTQGSSNESPTAHNIAIALNTTHLSSSSSTSTADRAIPRHARPTTSPPLVCGVVPTGQQSETQGKPHGNPRQSLGSALGRFQVWARYLRPHLGVGSPSSVPDSNRLRRRLVCACWQIQRPVRSSLLSQCAWRTTALRVTAAIPDPTHGHTVASAVT